MEARVVTLEAGMQEVRTILGRLEPMLERVDKKLGKVDADALAKLPLDVAELKGRVSQLPSTVTILGFVLAVLAADGLLRHFFP